MRKTGPETPKQPKPKIVALSRQRTEKPRKQITIRLDEDLLKLAERMADGEGVRVTELIERGLLDYMQARQPGETVRRGRFLWTVLPVHQQRVVTSFMAFVSRPRDTPSGEYFRHVLEDFCMKYHETPEYQADLEWLGRSRKPGAEG